VQSSGAFWSPQPDETSGGGSSPWKHSGVPSLVVFDHSETIVTAAQQKGQIRTLSCVVTIADFAALKAKRSVEKAKCDFLKYRFFNFNFLLVDVINVCFFAPEKVTPPDTFHLRPVLQ